jgi:hypothetical protein
MLLLDISNLILWLNYWEVIELNLTQPSINW